MGKALHSWKTSETYSLNIRIPQIFSNIGIFKEIRRMLKITSTPKIFNYIGFPNFSKINPHQISNCFTPLKNSEIMKELKSFRKI
jgi:hypothetical protein